ncbi:ribonuclease Z [Clostridia bacterium]|nr:ribonuclease Z [Clostridia bacterium]
MPLPERYLTCCFLTYEKGAVLIDCGEGTQVALRKAEQKLSKLSLLLITHFHADHVAGFPGLMLALANTGKTDTLTVAAPEGAKRILNSLLTIAQPLPFPVEYAELPRERGSFVHTFDRRQSITVDYLPLRHSTRCFGYSLTLARLPVFSPEKAEALGIPKPMYKLLHGGADVTLADGRVITPGMVLAGTREPIKVCYVTDTAPFAGISELASRSALFISEGMYGDDDMRASMRDKKHMLFSDSAKLAAAADVTELWLTHYSPAMLNPRDYTAHARKYFPNTRAGRDGMCTTLG